MSWNKEDKERLAEIRKEMIDLAEEAKDLIRMHGSRHDLDRAKGYYLGHILAALDNGEYMESNTMLKYLEELGYDSENDSFEDDEESEEENEDCEPDDDSNLEDEDRE